MDEKNQKWYFKTSVFVVALLCVGPLALPLLWFNPRFSSTMKIIITVAVIALSYYLTVVTANYIKTITDYYRQLMM